MKKLEKIIESVAALIFLFMLFCCLAQVLFRFVLKISAPWTEEFARMGYIWMVFLMLPVLESRNEQLKVTFFFDKIPLTARKIFYWFMSAVYVVLLGFTCYGGIRYFGNTKMMTFGTVRWMLMAYQYIPVIIGCGFGILFVVYRAIHYKTVFAQDAVEYETGEEAAE
ncbi:MAG: TRAP transporter small permease subunit [Ruminococcaceae bacterium]|jgi:TRAP-type C4-dicarboxylate transport system permease small subunit|nr:TRAP transporter small permease subunit [Oscillospiraceae bacterium]